MQYDRLAMIDFFPENAIILIINIKFNVLWWAHHRDAIMTYSTVAEIGLG
jgi:hypothetical protein